MRLSALLIAASGMAVALVSPAPAAQNSAARTRAFAKLQNWPGIWQQYDIGASGTPRKASGKEESFSGPDSKMNEMHPQFTEAWIEHMKTEVQHNPGTDKVCTFGYPWLLESSPLLFQVIITPEETTMIFNLREIRHIYTDGTGHTPDDIRLSTPWGDSAGHWEGDTLVIETISTTGRVWYDNGGKLASTVLSDKAVYHERIRMTDPNTLEDRFTIEDPVALKAPWSFVRYFHHVPHMTRLVDEEDCEGGNDRNALVNGKWVIKPSDH